MAPKTIRKACLLLIALNILTANAQQKNLFDTATVKPRLRVIIDNDFSGDPDGLFQLAHQLLSSSVEVRAIIGSHLKEGDGFDNSKTQADNAAKEALGLLKLLKLNGKVPVIAGSNTAMRNDSVPVKSEAVAFIIKEAMRTDTKAPLYVLCGAGLTEIASAVLTQPEIAKKITLVWIGGSNILTLLFHHLVILTLNTTSILISMRLKLFLINHPLLYGRCQGMLTGSACCLTLNY